MLSQMWNRFGSWAFADPLVDVAGRSFVRFRAFGPFGQLRQLCYPPIWIEQLFIAGFYMKDGPHS